MERLGKRAPCSAYLHGYFGTYLSLALHTYGMHLRKADFVKVKCGEFAVILNVWLRQTIRGQDDEYMEGPYILIGSVKTSSNQQQEQAMLRSTGMCR